MTTKVDATVIEEEETEQAGLSITYIPARIEANMKAFEQEVDRLVADYEDAQFVCTDDDTMKQIKRERAYLNAKRKEIDSRRIAIKKEYMKPFDAFEQCIKPLDSKIDDVTSKMKVALDEYDDICKKNRKLRMVEKYMEYADILVPVVSFDKLAEGTKWLNRSYSEVKAIEEMYEKIDSIDKDWQALKDLNIENYDDAESEFFKTLDVSSAIRHARAALEDKQRRDAMNAAIEQNQYEPEVPSEETPVQEVVEEAQPIPQPQREIIDAMNNAVPESEKIKNVPPLAPHVNVHAAPPVEEAHSWVIVIPSAKKTDMKAVAKILSQLNIQGEIKSGTISSIYQKQYGQPIQDDDYYYGEY